ncbi:hypothetical protein [Companilactobacillus farciminis]|uniref:hypothetical protein n=1 Tax=Companilactobacillus farciminis TaxID=1612 RepID=UPI001F48C762|nr:hypothetical protein [Companilactobacillus farciminis]
MTNKIWAVIVVLIMEVALTGIIVLSTFIRWNWNKSNRFCISAIDDQTKQVQTKVNPSLQGIIEIFNLLILNMDQHAQEQRQSEKAKMN